MNLLPSSALIKNKLSIPCSESKKANIKTSVLVSSCILLVFRKFNKSLCFSAYFDVSVFKLFTNCSKAQEFCKTY